MFADAIDVILRIWESHPPYNITLPGNRYTVSTVRTLDEISQTGKMIKPYQRPRPEIVGTVVAPFSKGVIAMGEKDMHPISANFLFEAWLFSHWENYARGKANVGIIADRSDWRVARTIMVNDDDKVAINYGKRAEHSPYRFYYRNLGHKLRKYKRDAVFTRDGHAPAQQVPLDDIVDQLVIAGSVNHVVDEILRLHEFLGGFGELVYAGLDWADPALARRSMVLMAEQVMPRVRAALPKLRLQHQSESLAL